jgi:hypothetical protein
MLPTFISGWDSKALKANVAFGAPDQVTLGPPETARERRYPLRAVKRRLHQASFREAVITAQTMIVRHSPGSRRITVGADKAYDVREFVDDLRDLNVTPHIAQNTTNRTSAIDARTTRHPGYAISQQKRKRTEEPFGWGKTIGGLARPMLRGAARLGFKFTMAACDLIRLPRLLGALA